MEVRHFYCEHLSMSSQIMADIASFTVQHVETGYGLINYLQKYALDDEQSGAMRTYLVRMKATDECVGYFSLKAGLVSLQESLVDGKSIFDTLPGVELANFAVNGSFAEKYKVRGIGKVIFAHFIIPLVRNVASQIGVCLVYLFALPQPGLIATYNEYGFQRLDMESEAKLHRRLKPFYDQSCIFMFYPFAVPHGR